MIVISDNGSLISSSNYLKTLTSDHVKYTRQETGGSLKVALNEAVKIGKKFSPTITAIWETDAIPDIHTFKAMLDVFIKERDYDRAIASVSPMYNWNGEYCYPTHNHWHTDPIYERSVTYGDITRTHAVPFLFSVWEPSLLEKYINRSEFRQLVHLDSDFGKFLSNMGFLHLRLKRYNISHHGGGKKSRR